MTKITLTPSITTIKDAIISDDGLYRYQLSRRWSEGYCITFVMLNPSTADAEIDDPTIRRCMNFAKRFGGGSMRVVNLYSFRSTNPSELWITEDPVGPENDKYLTTAIHSSEVIVAAWGSHAKESRVKEFIRLLNGKELKALGTTRDGSPRHPLYVPSDIDLMSWEFPSGGLG